jgi:1-phosphofructokinase family hexose kinase
MIITLTLNPSIDYILRVPQILVEDTLRAEKAVLQAGGKGINVSRVLTRLGINNIAWGFCGGDTGNWLRQYMDDEKVPHDFTQIRTATRINTIITEASTYKQIRISAPGGEVSDEEADILVEKFRQLPSDVHWVALGGSHPPGLSSSCTRRLIESANAQGARCILDADGTILKEGLKARPYLIKPNQYELERLLGHPVENTGDIVAGARSLINDRLVEVVVTSRAEAGALLITRDQVFLGNAPNVPIRSKVGAGDSMVAGIMTGLVTGAPFEEILRMGIAAGTAAVMTAGTELCHRPDYENLLKETRIEVPAGV